jgi:hypothetical protein
MPFHLCNDAIAHWRNGALLPYAIFALSSPLRRPFPIATYVGKKSGGGADETHSQAGVDHAP